MYESHFGLRGRPFRAGPDCVSYYPATTHENALNRLLQALRDDEGLCLLTGAPGLGKTLLAYLLLERLGDQSPTVFLANSHFPDRASLLQAILYDLAQPFEKRNEQELRLAVTDCLLAEYRKGGRTVLVVDEAQHLVPDLLEELRLLGNLEGGNGKALQVVLAAQPSFLDTLQWPELAGFRQRLAVRVQVEPLGLEEAADYLAHQLRVAGGRPEVLLPDEAAEVLARGTQGIPRLLNQAAHQALSLAFGAGAAAVDVEAALEALTMLGLDSETAAEPAPRFPSVRAGEDGQVAEGPLAVAEPSSAAEGHSSDVDAPAPWLAQGRHMPGLRDPSRRPA